ncbi:oxidoreductase NAD-binding domain-containing protein [Umbelopsis sp. AD052]|nr:oxidoreductase NAD-binding domain-containing protein [Umbelopsis sp. AD052]
MLYRTVVSSAIRATAAPTRLNAQRQTALGARAYSTDKPKSGGNGLLFAALAGLGVAGGVYYNSSSTTAVKPAAKPVAAATEVKAAFSPKEFKAFKLKEVQEINHNTSVFRFDLPEDSTSGLHVASCVITRYPITKKDGTPGYIIRPYTPTSDENAQGYVDFIVKKYPDGKMSKHFHDLKVGDELEIKGPIPKLQWEENKFNNVGLIAGGTGITPMLQIIRKVLNHSEGRDKTKITLVFANQTEEDILLKEELDKYAKAHPDQIKIHYLLDRPADKWTGGKGFVTKEIVQQYMPGPNEPNTLVAVCGPDKMVELISGAKAKDKSQGEIGGILKELGYTSENVFKF